MTKRTLYAQLATALLAVVLPLPAFSQSPAPGPLCASCLGVTILPGQKVLLPEDLAGVTILVRVSAAVPHPLSHSDVLSEITRRGGRPVVLLDPSIPSPVPDNFAYRLKFFLTQLRGEVPRDVPLALDASQPAVAERLPELRPYVDLVVGGGGGQPVVAAPADAIAARALIHAVAAEARRLREGLVDDVEVRGTRRLSVEEVIARHQAAARQQAGAIARTISSAVLTLTFEAPGFPAPVTITADTTLYADRERTDLAQQNIRVNGLAFKGSGMPRLPILEPERVASPPLTISLTSVYRYRLDGEEPVNGIRCYVVAFEPLDSSRPLFRGRAWIAMDGFAMVKVAATQTGLRGAIVSSEQVDEFRQAAAGVWLLAKSDVRQIYEGASHRTPIHRTLSVARHELDPPDFEQRRAAAYASDALLLRDTPDGYRYLRRLPGTPGTVAGPVEVAGAATNVRTLAAGVIIDPNISQPLPFAGLSYVDFDLFGTGTQLSGFFGGAYGQLAVAVPSIAGSRWHLGARAFGIASSYYDRAFEGGREIYEENLRQRPAHASVWVLRALTPRLSVRAGYALDYTRLKGSDETAAAFTVPSDQVVHALQLSVEGQRGGWAGSAWWHPARRSGWHAWGRPGAYDADTVDFVRYGVSASRATAMSPTVVTRVEVQWMDGQDLDRFSRYAFGTFDNRLRGYPSALVRYDRGAVARGVVAWSISRVARLDAFVDTAAVADRGYGPGLRNYTGVGLAAEAPAPFGLLAAVEWGYGFRGVNADGGLGTHVIRISAFKVF